METAIQKTGQDGIKPPITSVGIIGWIKSNLFSGVFNSILTLASLFLLWEIVPPLFKWAFLDGVWFTGSQACKQATGACWSIISANLLWAHFTK